MRRVVALVAVATALCSSVDHAYAARRELTWQEMDTLIGGSLWLQSCNGSKPCDNCAGFLDLFCTPDLNDCTGVAWATCSMNVTVQCQCWLANAKGPPKCEGTPSEGKTGKECLK